MVQKREDPLGFWSGPGLRRLKRGALLGPSNRRRVCADLLDSHKRAARSRPRLAYRGLVKWLSWNRYAALQSENKHGMHLPERGQNILFDQLGMLGTPNKLDYMARGVTPRCIVGRDTGMHRLYPHNPHRRSYRHGLSVRYPTGLARALGRC